ELLRLGNEAAVRFCVTEAAIVAMSVAGIEGMRAGTLYVSPGGGWRPARDLPPREIVKLPGILMTTATDDGGQCENYAGRLQDSVSETGCRYERLRPATQDWNSDLKRTGEGKPGNESGSAAACPAVASREAAPG